MNLHAKRKQIMRERDCGYEAASRILGGRGGRKAAAERRRKEADAAAVERERRRQAAMKID